MKNSQIKVVVDTNIIFMAVYNEESKAGKIIKTASENKLKLFAPISVRNELKRVLKRKFNWNEEEIEEDIEELPINWVEKEIYQDALEKTKIKHKADKPIEALALTLDCEILSADDHFKNIKQRIDINDLLEKLERMMV